jgi:hypothetical protein
VAVKAGRTARFLSAVVKVGRMARFQGASTWMRSETLAWRRTRRTWRRVRGGSEREEERGSAGVWRGNDRVRV